MCTRADICWLEFRVISQYIVKYTCSQAHALAFIHAFSQKDVFGFFCSVLTLNFLLTNIQHQSCYGWAMIDWFWILKYLPSLADIVWKRNSHTLQNISTIIIIITFKGAIRDFLRSPHSAANCLQHVRSNGPGTCNTSGAYHVQVPLGTKGQLSY